MKAITCYNWIWRAAARYPKQVVPKLNKNLIRLNWTEPSGHKTGISLYNSYGRELRPLVLQEEMVVKWYMCGPTVYDDAHIGHACCYVRFDIIRRLLQELYGNTVILQMGITDIDDKIIKKSIEEHQSFQDISKHYEKRFFRDMESLHILPPSISTRVSDFVPEIIQFIQTILDKKLAYITPQGTVYFDINACGQQGKLAPNVNPDRESRIEADKHKKDKRDFALWKAVKENEPFWDAPWGKGRPGWHIECSTMASQVFGRQLDIHSGGIDLVFPHHECEIYQSAAYHGNQQWANYWLHSGHLHLKNDVKMSKSLKNTISIPDLLTTCTPNQFRMFCVRTHYRKSLEFSEDSMNEAKGALNKVESFLQSAGAICQRHAKVGPIDEPLLYKSLRECKRRIELALADDFQTGRAVDAILDLVSIANLELGKTSDTTCASGNIGVVSALETFVARFFDVLGFQLGFAKMESANVSHVVDAAVKFRSRVRSYALCENEEHDKEEMKRLRKERSQLMQACDDYRKELGEFGITVKDRQNSSSWHANSNVFSKPC